MWFEIESSMVSYADDTYLFAPIPSPNDRQRVADMIGRDIARIQSWCNRWGMKLNPSKSNSLVVSRSRTLQPPHPNIIADCAVIPNCSLLKLLGITFDSKLGFETYLRMVASSISQKVGLLSKCRHIYSTDDVIRNYFYSFILLNFE